MLRGEKEDPSKATPVITNDDDYFALVQRAGITVVDVYAGWAGPCEAIQSIFKKLKSELGAIITFARVQSDNVSVLARFRNKSCPFFLIYATGILVREVKGVNAPLLEKHIRDEVAIENANGPHVPLYDESNPNYQYGNLKSRTVNNRVGSAVKKVDYNDGDEKTLAIIKPDAVSAGKAEEIKSFIIKNGFQIMNHIEMVLTPEKISELYREHETRNYYSDLVAFFSSGPSIVLVLSGNNAISQWRQIIGVTNPKHAKETEPKSLRAIYGTDTVRNAVHGSKSEDSAKKEIRLFFGEEGTLQRTFAMIKPDLVSNGKFQEVLDIIKEQGYTVVQQEQVQFTNESAGGFYVAHREKPYFENMVSWLSSSPVLALVLEKENAVADWRELIGPTNPYVARETAPNSLRARFGTNEIQNGLHGSKTIEFAAIETEYMFPLARAKSPSPTSKADLHRGTSNNLEKSGSYANAATEKTYGMIKPDAVSAGKVDEIISLAEKQGFKILAKQEFTFTPEKAKEFYAEHDGKEFFNNLIEFMTSGPSYGLVLQKENAIKGWREFIGPTKVDVAKETAPQSIRALFGTDGTKNAVHGSDSVTSAIREISIIFGADAAALAATSTPSIKELSSVTGEAKIEPVATEPAPAPSS